MNRTETPLSHLLKQQIIANGRMTFREFMQEALFHQKLGFYSKGPVLGLQEGTFNTSAMYPAFAWCLAHAVEQADARLGETLRIIEFGAGTGELGARIVSYLSCPHEYVIVETSSGLRKKQEARGLKVVTVVEELVPAPSFVFANEVVDALPVNRVMGVGQVNLLEMYVTLDQDGDFIEEFDEPSTSEIASRLSAEGIHLGRGHLAEVCLDIYPFIQMAASVISLGYLMIIDYGDDASALYSYLRKNGGLRCYFRQQQVYDPFDNIGDQDITTDVDFTALKSAAEKAGLVPGGRAWQGNWLKNLDIHKFQSHDMACGTVMAQIEQLAHPARLGSAFSVLAWKHPNIPDAPGFSPTI